MSFFSTLLSSLLVTASPRRLRLPPHRLLSKTSDSGHSLLPPPPSLKLIHTPEDKSAARAWIAEFKKHGIPRQLVRFTFSRSSGPGGQVRHFCVIALPSTCVFPYPTGILMIHIMWNVNKVNTKASLRCGVDAPWVPAWAKTDLRRSTYYVSSTDDIQITSAIHRSQAQNVEECLSQLHALLIAASSAPIKNDPTKEQQEKVKDLERTAKAVRRKEKTLRSHVKRGRRTKDWD